MTHRNKTKALIQSLSFIATFIVIAVALSQLKNFLPLRFERYAHGMLGTLAAVSTVWIFLRFENKSFKDLGLNWEQKSFIKFVIGLAAGIIIALVMVFSQILYSGLEITLNKNANFSFFLIWSLAFIPLAFMEEVAFRSYPFIRLNKVFGLRITQVVIAILFALYHVLMGWSIQTSFLGPGIWALAYGLTAVASNGISMPTGLHFGVNFILAYLAGKKGISSVYTIGFPNEVSESVIKANENFGIGIQISLLIICIIATELYLKRTKTTANKVYS